MTREVRKYSKEFKQEAVNLALKSPSIVNTAKELGIRAATLHTWIRALKSKGKLVSVDITSGKDMATLIEENGRLHKELVIANEELDKKIISIFNKHKRRYGAVRVSDELHDNGERCSKNRVARRMKHLG